MAEDTQDDYQVQQSLAHHLDAQLVALSPRSSSASMSVASELSSSTSKAASDSTAETSVASDTEEASSNAAGQADDAAASKSSTVDAAKDATKVEVLADKPGYRKELRTSPNGNKYLIETHGLWTTLRSLTPILKKRSIKERLGKKIVDFTTFWPFLLRFAKEVINLGRWRFLLHLVASTLTGLTPVRLGAGHFAFRYKTIS